MIFCAVALIGARSSKAAKVQRPMEKSTPICLNSLQVHKGIVSAFGANVNMISANVAYAIFDRVTILFRRHHMYTDSRIFGSQGTFSVAVSNHLPETRLP